MDKKKPSLAMLLIGKKGDDAGPEEDAPADAKDMKRSAMSAFIDAVHDKDADAALDVFQDLQDMCGEPEESEES